MTMPFTDLAAGPLQSVPADTVVFVAAADRLTTWAQISTVVLAVLFAVLIVATIAALVQLRQLVRMTHRLTRDVQSNVGPVAERARVVGDNVAYVSAVVRDDVVRLSDSVAALTGRLNQASDRIEERIEEFNALLEVAQSEAEDLFIDTASTVRAVKAGARSLSRPQTPGADEEAEP